MLTKCCELYRANTMFYSFNNLRNEWHGIAVNTSAWVPEDPSSNHARVHTYSN